jgi:hypothetical protein
MDMLVGSDELELTSKGLAEAPGVVPRHLKPTATFGTIESEG